MLETLNVPTGGWVVFSAAGSALSRMGISLAKHWGLKTVGIVRRDEQREEVEQHGADAAVSSASEDVVARIKEITGGQVSYSLTAAVAIRHAFMLAVNARLSAAFPSSEPLTLGSNSCSTHKHPPCEIFNEQGAHAGIDSVGGETTSHIVQSLRVGGKVYVYGAMSGFTAQVDLVSLLFHDITVQVCKLLLLQSCSITQPPFYAREHSLAVRCCPLSSIMQGLCRTAT
jgi:NADPH:quinone reductase-like Zn-dependent oxidoreductase